MFPETTIVIAAYNGEERLPRLVGKDPRLPRRAEPECGGGEELETLEGHLAPKANQIAIGSRGLPESDLMQQQPPLRHGTWEGFSTSW